MTELPTFIHMKSKVQNIPTSIIEDDWTKTLPTYYKDYKNFKIGNFQITYPFHYVEKTWLTKDMIKQLEENYARR
jgi:hypothetical protein